MEQTTALSACMHWEVSSAPAVRSRGRTAGATEPTGRIATWELLAWDRV